MFFCSYIFFLFSFFFPFMISKMWIKKNFWCTFQFYFRPIFFSHSPLFTTPSHCLLTNPNWIRNYTPPFKIIINIKIAKQFFFFREKKIMIRLCVQYLFKYDDKNNFVYYGRKKTNFLIAFLGINQIFCSIICETTKK